MVAPVIASASAQGDSASDDRRETLGDEARFDLPWEEIRKAHVALMRAYVGILIVIAELPVRNKLRDVETHDQFAAARKIDANPRTYVRPFLTKGIAIPKAMVRVFAERHMTRQLRELAACYTQFRVTFPADQMSGGTVEWLGLAAEGSRAFADSLVAWKSIRAVLHPLWALVVAIGLTDLAAVVFKQQPDVLWRVGFSALWIGVYVVLFVTDAFALKREFFLPGAQFMDRSEKLPPMTRNVYEMEAELFRLLRRARTPEFPWDHASRLVALLLFQGALAAVTISLARSWPTRVVFILLAVPMLVQTGLSISSQLATRLKHRLH